MSTDILLVSDSASDQQNIQKILNDYNVLIATNEPEAMRVLEANKTVFLMLLDMDIPDLDGISFLQTLKASEKHNNLHTIVLSEREGLGRVIAGLKLGIVDYVRIPFDSYCLKVRIDARTELLKCQDLLQQSYEDAAIIFETIYMQVPVGVSIFFTDFSGLDGINGQYNYNPAYQRILGRTEKELRRLGWEGVTYPDDLEKDLENFEKLKSGEINSYSMEKRMLRADGSLIWVHILVATIHLPEHRGFSYITVLQDIDDQKTMTTSLIESERSKSVLLSNLNGMAYRCAYDPDWTMEFVSSGCHTLCGCEPESLIDNKVFSFNDLIAPEYRKYLYKEWRAALESKAKFHSEYEIIDADGNRKWVMELGEGIFDEDDEIEALEGIIIDITDRKDAEDKLRYASEHHWTGLYNLNHLETVLAEDLSDGTVLDSALISVNLNSMYSLTVKYGMQYSQKLTAEIAAALKKLTTGQRLLFATASHRFVFYVKEYKNKDELADFCEEIRVVVKSFLDMDRITFGIGVYEISEAAVDGIEGMLYSIRLASEEAIASKDEKNNIYFYDDKLEKRVFRGNLLRHELASVAEGEDQDRIILQFQPIVNVSDNNTTSYKTQLNGRLNYHTKIAGDHDINPATALDQPVLSNSLAVNIKVKVIAGIVYSTQHRGFNKRRDCKNKLCFIRQYG